jgi:hypothetical protein
VLSPLSYRGGTSFDPVFDDVAEDAGLEPTTV